MIIATIQGISRADNGKHITAYNGSLITGKEQENRVNELFRSIGEIDVSEELFCFTKQGQCLCAIEHPQKDEMGRIRTALILYDKDTSDAMIKQTLEVMGLEHERFDKLRQKYFERQKRSQFLLIALCAVAVIIIVFMALSSH